MPPSYITINWTLPKSNSRNELRKFVVLKFMEENPGKGTGDLISRYKYIVEIFPDGRKLYLIRPARRKYGFDFQIWMENWNNEGNNKLPSHDDIIQDLKIKKEENQAYFILLLKSIDKVFICEDDDRIFNMLNEKNVTFSEGEDIAVLLKIIKWMFIEQDIRYWNFSGRFKLKNYIDRSF
ncbi:MAG: DNA adenine methylase [Promethearchaeota archaeon]|nr:MAG: DNA adenine methylase [Candidatus Lokiarchaeota archaeon]